MNIDPLFLIMGFALAFSAGAEFGGWYVQREAKGPIDQGRDWTEGER